MSSGLVLYIVFHVCFIILLCKSNRSLCNDFFCFFKDGVLLISAFGIFLLIFIGRFSMNFVRNFSFL